MDKTAAYGLGDAGNSTQASFFDYDTDGDLDVYVINGPEDFFRNEHENKVHSSKSYENVNGKFVDVTKSSGI